MLVLLAPLSAVLILGVMGGIMVARSRQDRVARVVVGQMAMVMSQNLPMGTGLMLAAQGERGKARRVLIQIAELIMAGLPLSEAVSRGYPKASAMVRSVIEVGERAGRLPATLRMLQEELAVREERRNGGMDGVFYGVILLAVLFVVWSATTVVVFPKLYEIARDFGTALPPLTMMATAPSRWHITAWPWVVMAIVLILVAIVQAGYRILWVGLWRRGANAAEGTSFAGIAGGEKFRWSRPTIQEIAAMMIVLGLILAVIEMISGIINMGEPWTTLGIFVGLIIVVVMICVLVRCRQTADTSASRGVWGTLRNWWNYRPTIQELAMVLVLGVLVCVIALLVAVNVTPSVGRFTDWTIRAPSGLISDLAEGAAKGIGILGEEMPIETLIAIGFLVAIPMAVSLGLRGRRTGRPYLSSRIADHVRWHVPGLRRMEMCKGLATTCGLMRLFTRAGMELQRAVRLAAETDMNIVLRERLLRMAHRLDEGVPPPAAAQEVGLGEVFVTALRAGQYGDRLDASLRYAEAYHRAMVSRIWVAARTLSWPVMTLIVAALIGMFVVALFLPIVRFLQAVSLQV